MHVENKIITFVVMVFDLIYDYVNQCFDVVPSIQPIAFCDSFHKQIQMANTYWPSEMSNLRKKNLRFYVPRRGV